ncbi:MAG: hypothetical protein ACTTKL_01525 [Treponema sp.]
MKDKLKAFLYIILFFLTLLAVINPVNYVVDRANRLHNIYPQMASLIMEGKPVFIETGDLDERMLKFEMIKYLPKTGLTLALGPSFIMGVNKDVLETEVFYNLATSGSTAYDDLNTLGMLKFYGIKPERLLLSVNTKYFVRALFSTDERHKPFDLYGKYYLTSPPPPAHKIHSVFRDLKNLLSISYFQTNLDYIRKNKCFRIRERCGIWTEENTRNAYMPDGSWIYEKKRRDITEAEVIRACNEFDIQDRLGINESIDMESKDVFNKTILDLQSQGVMVDLFISPLPPALWKRIKETSSTRLFEDILNFVKQYDSVRIFGSFDPSNYNLTNADYYDPMHLRREKLGVLFEP